MEKQLRFIVNGKEVNVRPQNGERYTQQLFLNGKLVCALTQTATTPEQREQTKIDQEKVWRNQELDFVDAKNYGESFPYFAEVEAYKQALRDYPSTPNFPHGERPQRPVTDSGTPIII